MKILIRVVVGIVAVLLYFTITGLLTARRDSELDGIFILIGLVVYIFIFGNIFLLSENRRRNK